MKHIHTEHEVSTLEHKRHSLAHLLAAAVIHLYPQTQITIGPAVENGFYYDIDFSSALREEQIAKGRTTINEEDLPEIEACMKRILAVWSDTPRTEHGFVEKQVSVQDAEMFFANNPYKLELIKDISAKGESITLYTSGTGTEFEFTDLCRGGHVTHPSDIDPDSFTLNKVAGAYWKGDEKNQMLTRIYGIAFDNKAELDTYLNQLEEAKKRDHRKLGKELKLFTLSDLVGSGLPLFQPKGAILRKELEDYLWDLHKKHGYQRVWTPHLAKADLYMTSGHGMHYLADMFSVHGGTSKEEFYLKPMSCPHHMQLFADNLFSYRNMPVRYFEPATVYRDEKTGQLGGLTRVRSITQDDGHLYCRMSQLKDEARLIVNIIKNFYKTMGMLDGYRVRLSLRDDNKETWLGTDEMWEVAEKGLVEVCQAEQLPYFEGKGEAAFYGPKLDFMFRDAIGREHQLATIQYDFNAPERFNLSFINEQGEKERPVVIHRAISGSVERFLGLMIEHFAGAFPVWLSPVQVKVVPIGERQMEYAQSVYQQLMDADVRVELDASNDGLGKKIRAAKSEMVPYVLVVGDKEIEAQAVTVEGRPVTQADGTQTDGKIGQMKTEDFIAKIKEEIKSRALN